MKTKVGTRRRGRRSGEGIQKGIILFEILYKIFEYYIPQGVGKVKY